MKRVFVPGEATEEMLVAGEGVCDMFARDCYTVMLAAAPAPSPDEIDELCRAMWPNSWWWQPDVEAQIGTHSFARYLPEYIDNVRAEHRNLMSAFLKRLGDQ